MIKTENLSFSYTGLKPFILDGINMEIRDGEYVSVVGDNGCGKSTLIRLLLRLIKPTAGSITNCTKRTGYVPQKSEASMSGFPITVYEMLNSYRKLLKIKDRETVFEALKLAGLSGLSNALIGTLSGGQFQKALIARALLGSPDLLVLDEPSSGVDNDSQRDIYGLIKRLNAEKGLTIISVEHNLNAAVSNSTLIYHLSGGRGHFCTPSKYAEEYLKGQVD
jgi:zinc transport system ATP-binding protein